jgi:hypothetical protein
MSSRGIDFSKLQPEPEEPKGPTRHIVSVGENLDEFLDKIKTTYPFFGVLLPGSAQSKVNEYIQTHWGLLHRMSGKACLLLTPLVPKNPTDEERKVLVDLLGERRANQAWERYHYDAERAASDAYTLAQEIHIGYDRLPCLVLMTNFEAKQRLIQRVPAWDAESLTAFFQALFNKIAQHAGEPDLQARLNGVKGDLGTGFMLKLHAEHIGRRIGGALEQIEWAEIIQSTLTNKELMAGAFKLFLGVLGLAAG